MAKAAPVIMHLYTKLGQLCCPASAGLCEGTNLSQSLHNESLQEMVIQALGAVEQQMLNPIELQIAAAE